MQEADDGGAGLKSDFAALVKHAEGRHTGPERPAHSTSSTIEHWSIACTAIARDCSLLGSVMLDKIETLTETTSAIGPEGRLACAASGRLGPRKDVHHPDQPPPGSWTGACDAR